MDNEENESLVIDLRDENKDYVEYKDLPLRIEMLLILITSMVVAQIILFEWKKRYLKSFQLMTTICVWMIPFIMCFILSYWMFMIIWTLFSIITGLVVRKALGIPLQRSTPRLVYKWFYFVYKITFGFGILGYLIMGSAILEIIESAWLIYGWTIMYYGLYFCLLGQDIAEICTSKMTAHIGYYTPQGLPTRYLEESTCAVCGNKLLVSAGEEGIIESTYRLSCNHIFHEFCIRGWCIIGKKQICPYCREKVDLERMFPNPWDKPHILFGQLLIELRLVIIWGPIITVIAYILSTFTST